MAKAARRFQYTPRSRDDVKERANMRGGGFDSFLKPAFKKYKILDGKNIVRILPPTWEGARHYGLDIWVNYGIGADNQSYLSISKMKSEKDPIVEMLREAQRAGDETLARQLDPRQRVLMWIIDRQHEEEGPQLLDAPFTLDKSFVNISLDEDTREVIFVDDPEKGCDIRFYKEGTGLATKYPGDKMKLLKTTPLCDDDGLMEEWLEYVQNNPLPECLNFYDYDHIKSVADGKVVKKADADDEDDARIARRKKIEPVDEDEPKPKPRARLSKPEPEPEPEEDDEVSIDEEDDPPAKVVAKQPAAKDEVKPGGIRDRIRARRTIVEDED